MPAQAPIETKSGDKHHQGCREMPRHSNPVPNLRDKLSDSRCIIGIQPLWPVDPSRQQHRQSPAVVHAVLLPVDSTALLAQIGLLR